MNNDLDLSMMADAGSLAQLMMVITEPADCMPWLNAWTTLIRWNLPPWFMPVSASVVATPTLCFDPNL